MSIVYNRGEDVIEITVFDPTSKKIEHWKFNINDVKRGNKILGSLISKYGFEPEIDHMKQVQELREIEALRNKDWLNLDVNL